MLYYALIERRPFFGDIAVRIKTIRHGGSVAGAYHFSPIFGYVVEIFLPVGDAQLRMRLHGNTWVGSIHPCFPTAFCSGYLPVADLSSRLAHIPNVAVQVLG